MTSFELNKLENILEDISRRCRTCLGICAEFNDLSKYVEVGDVNMSLTELIANCASVQILEQDGLPQRICETCKEAAIKSHLFAIQCQTTNKYLTALSQNLIIKSTTSTLEEIVNITLEQRCEETVKLEMNENEENLSRESPAELLCKKNEEKEFSADDETLKNPQFVNFESGKIDEKHTCYSCNKTFSSKKILIKHLKIQKYKCATCEFTFHDLNEYMTHRNLHRTDLGSENVKKRTCLYCDKIFQYRSSMLKHQRTHNAPSRTCNYCNFKPTTPGSLSKHMEQMHFQHKNFTCSLCGKGFFKKPNLRIHIQLHSGVKKHTCETCGISFNLRGNLSVHRRLHTGERPYTCSICGRGFAQQSALRSHEAGHSDKRDHVCPECGAAFSRAGALRNHQKRHSPSKPFECSICGKKFTFSSERKRHMLIHSGDKNYECEVCGKRFSRNANLKVHKRIHSGETPHVCNICGKGFIQAHSLRTHVNTHSTKGD